MSKKSKIFLSLFAVFVTALLCASIVLSVFTINSVNKNTTMVKAMTGAVEDVDAEDDVLIANTYLIKSTKQISDAYKSNDSSKLSDADRETLDLASKILDEIIKPDMSDYEKEKAVYVYLTTKLKSTNGILTVIAPNTENSEPHDVLKNKSAVCVGYATTFRMFMQMMDIECMVVHSSDLSHSWDLVKLDDGWYHVDCYSDETTGGTTTVAEYDEGLGGAVTATTTDGQDNVKDIASYANFNMDDNYCAANHNWNRSFFPAADGKKYNYILNNTKQLKNIYKLPDYVAKMVSKKKSLIVCSFKSFDEKAQYEANYMADSLQNNLINDTRSVDYRWATDADGNYIFIMNVSYFSESSLYIGDKASEKIDNSVFEAIDKYELNR